MMISKLKKFLIPALRRNFRLALYRLRGKQIVHFLHIGKTGGNALKFVLASNSTTGKYAINIHPHPVKLRDIPKGEKVIFFVRDPIRRFISGFYSRMRKGQPRNNNPWTPDEEVAFKQFRTANELAKALSSADKEIQNAAVKAMKRIHHVKMSYWYWFDNESYFLSRISDILFVGLQEKLNDDFLMLKEKLGLPDAAKLPTDEIESHKNPSHYDTHLEEQAAQNLMSWYKRDYEFVKLCKETVRRDFQNQSLLSKERIS